MSKRNVSPTLDRPVVRLDAPSAQGDVLSIGALTPPVEPSRAPIAIPFEQINPELFNYAPIHFYLRDQFDGKYSRQCLIRRLEEMINQSSWHALCGVKEHRALHAANCTLIEALLSVLDEREVAVAA